MSVSINGVHDLAYFIAAKQKAAFPSPDEFNSYAQLANVDLFNYYNDERTKELVRVKQGESIYVPPVLANFVQYNVVLPAVGNVVTSPSDYIYDLQMTAPSGALFKKADYDKVQNYLNSSIDAPTNTNPIYVELADAFEIYPTLSPVKLTYLAFPQTVFWNYTLVQGHPVYNPLGSVDFQYDDTEILRLTMRILKYMGVSIRDNELQQYANEMINTAS